MTNKMGFWKSAVLTTAAVAFVNAQDRPRSWPPGAEVHGYVAAAFPAQGGTQEIALPNAKVSLTSADGQTVAQSAVTTNSRGYFRIPSQPPGAYSVCAEAPGFERGCAEKQITIGNYTVLLSPHLILKPVGAAIHGHVQFSDGSAAARTSPSAYSSAGAAEITVIDASGKTVAGPAQANSSGDFVVPSVPAAPGLRVSIRYEAATEVQALNPGAAPLVLVLKNSPPTIESVTATLGGKAVSQAPPGSTVMVTVRATDPDKDVLHYSWQDSGGHLVSRDKASIGWKLPNAPGANTVFVEVRDGKGGTARASISVATVAPAAAGKDPVTGPVRVAAASVAPVSPVSIFERIHRFTIGYRPPAHSGNFIDPQLIMSCPDETTCEAETVNYYKAIGVFDSNGNPTANLGSLPAWKAAFNFSADPTAPAAGEFRTVYYNNADLQLGRDMHCRQNTSALFLGGNTACYVTNFSSNQLPASGNDPQVSIQLADTESTPIATVAMVFATSFALPVAGGTPTPPLVNFFVYDAAGNPLKAAILDGEGPKAVPGVCLACHGGAYDSTLHITHNSNFLPFDTPSFIQSSSIIAILEPNQRESFRQMNNFVQGIAFSPTIPALVAGWYSWCGGVAKTGCYIDDVANPFIPSGTCTATATNPFPTCGWDSGTVSGATFESKSFYQQEPRVFCRTCHIARPETFNVQNFTEFTGAGQVDNAVCSSHIMPDASVPYLAFWFNFPAQDAMQSLLKAASPSGFTKCR
jgi:hypothetical protein